MEEVTKTYENLDLSAKNHEPSMNQGLLRKRHVFQSMIATTLEEDRMPKPMRTLTGQRKEGRSSSLTPTNGLLFERQAKQSFSGTFLQSHIMPAMKTSTKSGGLESSRIKSSNPSSNHIVHSTGNTDRKRRIRFLSADHVPRDVQEEPESFASHDRREIKSKTKAGTKNFQKSERAKIYLGSGPQNGVGRGSKVESPEVWLQKARQRKVAKGSKVIKKQTSPSEPSKDDDGNAEGYETLDTVTYALSRTNFCDIRKNARILKWLAEVNSQTYFDTVEPPS